MSTDISLNVVLFPKQDCALDFSSIDEGWLIEVLNLQSANQIKILRPDNPEKRKESLLRLQCTDWETKQHVLRWDTRCNASKTFAVRIKEDLRKFERTQKARMWRVMQALFQAGLRPTWSRASVTWKTTESRFIIHPGELSDQLSTDDIVSYARSGCKHVPPPQTRTYAEALKSRSDYTSPPPSHPEPSTSVDNLVVALQQEVGLAKRTAAATAVQCCMWRMRAKRAEAKLATVRAPCGALHKSCQTDLQPSLETVVAHSYLQTNASPPLVMKKQMTEDTAVQTDINAYSQDGDEMQNDDTSVKLATVASQVKIVEIEKSRDEAISKCLELLVLVKTLQEQVATVTGQNQVLLEHIDKLGKHNVKK